MAVVTVIFPVYRTAALLGAALDSVLRQTFRDFEIICVNDGSPDNAEEILRSYARRDLRVHVISQENRGLSTARNAGLDAATGTYILFLDSDDMLPAYALERMVEVAESSHAEMVVSEMFLREDCAPEAAGIPGKAGFRLLKSPMKEVLGSRQMRSSACNKLYRRDFIGSHRFVKGILFEDWPFLTVLMSGVSRVAVVKEPCYVYRRTGGSTIRSPFTDKKVLSYARGIVAVAEALSGDESWPLARARCAKAASMMISKSYKSGDPHVRALAVAQLRGLRRRGFIRYRDLAFKALWRALRMGCRRPLGDEDML